MKRVTCLLLALLMMLCGCGRAEKCRYINAAEHGVLTENSGEENSANLQKLIDDLTENGGTIYIPAGEYVFAENGSQTIGTHCIKMRSNVSIVGDGSDTVLKPVGASRYGLDMFYFNDYLDTGDPVYLENCCFTDFVIDASNTSCEVYTSAGKGFMFNLFRNCHWQRVTVLHTDATGFGVDCPIDSSITDCTAIGCGKAATIENGGASGFGIGYGYCAEEGLIITGCRAEGNKKFGFFFEHQGRFDSEMYTAEAVVGFRVLECTALGNLYNYGGISAFGGVYEGCVSNRPLRTGCYFENCSDFAVKNCAFWQSQEYDIQIEGRFTDLILTGNCSDRNRLLLGQAAETCVNTDNTWNDRES